MKIKRSSPVTVEITIDEEFLLMSIYGRKCSREGLVKRAIADAIKNNGAAPAKAEQPKKERKKKDAPAPLLNMGDGVDDPERNFSTAIEAAPTTERED